MSIAFCFGGSGSGKTYTVFNKCISESISHPERRFFVIVPEQYTMQTQREIVRLHPDHATDNIEVLSFNRLAYHIFGELGINNPPVLDDIGKAMILRKIAKKCDEHMTIWSSQYRKIGFIDALKSVISEFYQYGIKPEDIKDISREDIMPAVIKKLADLMRIYDTFSSYIRDRYITSEEVLDILARNIYRSSSIDHADVIFDGFTGFTPIQYKIIEHIITKADHVYTTVTISDDDPYSIAHEEDLFYMSKTMVSVITDIASRNNISNEGDIYLSDRPFSRYQSMEIAAIEEHFLRYDGYIYDKPCHDIQIVSATRMQEELEYVISHIEEMIAIEGYRYKDIAIVCGDISSYEDEISHICTKHDIPYYIDANISISHNPLIEMIRAAIAVQTSRYSHDAIMRYIRSGLVADDMDIADIADNYMLQMGIHGYDKMRDRWSILPADMEGTDIESLNKLKDSILDTLEPIRNISTGLLTASSMTNAIKEFLDDIHASDKMKEYAQRFQKVHDDMHHREFDKVYDEIIKLLDMIDSLLGDEEMDIEEYEGLITAGLSQISIGMMPESVDRLLIGDLTRSRFDDIKALFIIGAIEGTIPRVAASGTILTDRDKDELKKRGIELAPTIKDDLYMQRYYLYRMTTKPSDKLIITYPGMDRKGQSCRLSSTIKSLGDMLGISSYIEASSHIHITSREGAISYISSHIRDIISDDDIDISKDHIDHIAMIDKISKNDIKLSDRLSHIYDGASYRYIDTGLGKVAATALFGKKIIGSVTRLQEYALCPYKHFMRYGLGLIERREYKIDAADIGTIVHAALEKIFAQMISGGHDITKVDSKMLHMITTKAVQEAILDDKTSRYTSTYRNAHLIDRIAEMTSLNMDIITAQLSAGKMRPYAIEETFSYRDGLRGLDIKLSDGYEIGLVGKIDRIDLYEDDDDIFVRIVDYKTSDTSWKYNGLYEGTHIQLAVYMDAIRELLSIQNNGKKVIPAAMEYYSMVRDMINTKEKGFDVDDIYIRDQLIAAGKPSGIVNADENIMMLMSKDIDNKSIYTPYKDRSSKGDYTADNDRFDKIQDYVRHKIEDIGEDIIDGNISISPIKGISQYDTCQYCTYRSICGFESKIKGYRYRKSIKDNSKEVWNKMDSEVTSGS